MAKRKLWHGTVPTNCELCNSKIDKVFTDFNTSRGWALICEECRDDRPLGIGLGQKYERRGSVWEKIDD